MHTRLVLALVGCALLFVGVFTPLVSVPFGTMTYFNNGQGDGVIVLGLVGLALILLIFRRLILLLVPGVISLAMLAYSFIGIQSRIAGMAGNLGSQLQGNPFAGLARLMVQSVHIEWGWAVLLIGSLCLIAAAVWPVPRPAFDPREWEYHPEE